MAGGEAGSILKRLLFRASARADLDQIYLWTAEKFGLAQAEDYVSGLVRMAEDASSEPLSWRDAGHIRSGLLRTGFQSHVLYAVQTPAAFEVIRILHGGMDADRWV